MPLFLMVLIVAVALPNAGASAAAKVSVDQAKAECRREHGPRLHAGHMSQDQFSAVMRSCVQARMKAQRGAKKSS